MFFATPFESACVFESAFNFFDSVITPTIFLFFWHVQVVGNLMLCSIVKWTPPVDNDWHALMQKMNKNWKCTTNFQNHIMDWNIVGWIISFRCENYGKIASGKNSWAAVTNEWCPHQWWHMNHCVNTRRRISRPAETLRWSNIFLNCNSDKGETRNLLHWKITVYHCFRRPIIKHGVLMKKIVQW